jgi:CheY-like chemotaxis protein
MVRVHLALPIGVGWLLPSAGRRRRDREIAAGYLFAIPKASKYRSPGFIQRDAFSLHFGDGRNIARRRPVKSLRVAVVDDDEALCWALADLLRSIGYRVELFESAEMFLNSTDLLPFDCIIADVHMPGMGGLNLVRRLQEQGTTTPVILITGLPNRNVDDEAVSAGAQCVLRKPFKSRTLLDCIERSLSDERPSS